VIAAVGDGGSGITEAVEVLEPGSRPVSNLLVADGEVDVGWRCRRGRSRRRPEHGVGRSDEHARCRQGDRAGSASPRQELRRRSGQGHVPGVSGLGGMPKRWKNCSTSSVASLVATSAVSDRAALERTQPAGEGSSGEGVAFARCGLADRMGHACRGRRAPRHGFRSFVGQGCPRRRRESVSVLRKPARTASLPTG
jgi:hypothetical protein